VITTTSTARNIRLIEETSITFNTILAYHVEYNAQGTPLHHGFSLLITVMSLCACVEHYPWVYCTR